MLTWRIITGICHWFVALLNNITCWECNICLWQKFCALEVSSSCLNTNGYEGPLYCGGQLHQCWSTLSRVCNLPALSSWSHLQLLVIHTLERVLQHWWSCGPQYNGPLLHLVFKCKKRHFKGTELLPKANIKLSMSFIIQQCKKSVTNDCDAPPWQN